MYKAINIVRTRSFAFDTQVAGLLRILNVNKRCHEFLREKMLFDKNNVHGYCNLILILE